MMGLISVTVHSISTVMKISTLAVMSDELFLISSVHVRHVGVNYNSAVRIARKL